MTAALSWPVRHAARYSRASAASGCRAAVWTGVSLPRPEAHTAARGVVDGSVPGRLHAVCCWAGGPRSGSSVVAPGLVPYAIASWRILATGSGIGGHRRRYRLRGVPPRWLPVCSVSGVGVAAPVVGDGGVTGAGWDRPAGIARPGSPGPSAPSSRGSPRSLPQPGSPHKFKSTYRRIGYRRSPANPHPDPGLWIEYTLMRVWGMLGLSQTDRDNKDSELAMEESEQKLTLGVRYQTVSAQCEGPGCRVVIEQPKRPGTRRRFCSDRCRQRASRQNRKRPDAQTQAWLRAMQQL